MSDPVTLAAAAVTILMGLLKKAAEKVGEKTAASLIEGLKRRLDHHSRAQEALEELAEQPGDVDAPAVLRKELQKAVKADPSLAAQLQQWMDESKKVEESLSAHASGGSQSANATGGSTVVQIMGSGNNVGKLGS
jgi:hypothetical protein